MRKKIYLYEFIELVKSNKEFFNVDIIIKNTKKESKLLEEFCTTNINKQKYEEAWSIILDAIAEHFYPHDMTSFFTEKTLNYLIDNNVNLNDLAHLQLDNKWLKKIYQKDKRCIEALRYKWFLVNILVNGEINFRNLLTLLK